jgi:hypothetical protein
MDWSIEDCINYCRDHDLIGLVNHQDLLDELDDLRKDQDKLTEIMLYGEEDDQDDI